MTDSSSKVQALTTLLEQVIHSLDMAQYEMEDPSAARAVEHQAYEYYDQMVAILHGGSGEPPESALEP